MKLGNVFHTKKELMPICRRQAALLLQGSQLLCNMLETMDQESWKSLYKDIRNLEHQGDAVLDEFRTVSAHCFLRSGPRRELTTIAMSVDDALDVVKDAANALLIYKPARIDPQLKELAHIIQVQAQVLNSVLIPLENERKNQTQIKLLVDRVTELERDADETYENYVGYIFAEEPDLREMTKYKNLAELFEKATDTVKRASDDIRILVMRYDH